MNLLKNESQASSSNDDLSMMLNDPQSHLTLDSFLFNNGEDHGGEDKIAEKQGGGCQENDEIQTLSIVEYVIVSFVNGKQVVAENSIFQAKAESAITIPKRSQGHCGSCWAVGAAESLSDCF
uniref:Peptidase C1A papain C-terminal domain-containing protein n=1 Tax=Solanum lycopersicum TaxID=4081 RepID=A0A3Q7EZX7_SOLLC